MMKRYFLAATPIAAMLLLTGCMDDNYDLSNIEIGRASCRERV